MLIYEFTDGNVSAKWTGKVDKEVYNVVYYFLICSSPLEIFVQKTSIFVQKK